MRRLMDWLFGRVKPQDVSEVSERFREMHRVVVERFPDTPWVYGGAWCWFSVSFRCVRGVIVYPYLPLVLIDSESYDLSEFVDILKSCSSYAIPVVTVDDGESPLLAILDRVSRQEDRSL